MSLNDKMRDYERRIKRLEDKILDLTSKTEAKRLKPESKVPTLELGKSGLIPSTGTGLGKVPGRQGNIIFNDADSQILGFGQMPSAPTKGYNKHSHSRYSGGALDINTLELIEYEDLDISGHNRDCQSYWFTQPKIAQDEEGNDKISLLKDNMVWDEENQCWRFYAVYKD